LTVDHADNLAAAREALTGLAVGEIHLEPGLRRLTVPVSAGSQALVDAVGRLGRHRVQIHNVALRRPSLDDVFLTLTGHEAAEPAEAADPAPEPAEGRSR
jgi:ABC-2 type transport system ATP-binding protein